MCIFQTIYYDDITTTEYPANPTSFSASPQVPAPFTPVFAQPPIAQPQIFGGFNLQQPFADAPAILPKRLVRRFGRRRPSYAIFINGTGAAPVKPYSFYINGTTVLDPLSAKQAAWRMNRLENELSAEQQQVVQMKHKVRAHRRDIQIITKMITFFPPHRILYPMTVAASPFWTTSIEPFLTTAAQPLLTTAVKPL